MSDYGDNGDSQAEGNGTEKTEDELLAEMMAQEEAQKTSGDTTDASAESDGDETGESIEVSGEEADIATLANADDADYGSSAGGVDWAGIDDIIHAIALLYRSPIEQRRALGALYHDVTDDELLKARPLAEIVYNGRSDKAQLAGFITSHIITVTEAMKANDFAAVMGASRAGADWAYSIPDGEKKNVWRAFAAVQTAFPKTETDDNGQVIPVTYTAARTTKNTQGNEIAAMLDDLISYVDTEAMQNFRSWEVEVVSLLDPAAVSQD